MIDAASNYASHFQLVQLSALLISTYLKLEDEENLQWLVKKIISSNKWRRLLAATIDSHDSWLSPSAESTLATLYKTRAQQLLPFKFPEYKWEQPDAVFNGHPEVETFLRSAQESMVYSVFKNDEDARVFASDFFDRQDFQMGYRAFMPEIIPAVDDGMVSVRITKTLQIYELSLKQLKFVKNFFMTRASPVEAD